MPHCLQLDRITLHGEKISSIMRMRVLIPCAGKLDTWSLALAYFCLCSGSADTICAEECQAIGKQKYIFSA